MYLSLLGLFKRRNRIRDRTETFFILFFMSLLFVALVLDSLIGTKMRGCNGPTRIRIQLERVFQCLSIYRVRSNQPCNVPRSIYILTM